MSNSLTNHCDAASPATSLERVLLPLLCPPPSNHCARRAKAGCHSSAFSCAFSSSLTLCVLCASHKVGCRLSAFSCAFPPHLHTVCVTQSGLSLICLSPPHLHTVCVTQKRAVVDLLFHVPFLSGLERHNPSSSIESFAFSCAFPLRSGAAQSQLVDRVLPARGGLFSGRAALIAH